MTNDMETGPMTDPETDGARLLACPFCGGKVRDVGPYGEDLFAVRCDGCMANVSGFDQCRQDAIAAWNTRSAPARCDEPVALPLAVRLRDEEGPPLPQMIANRRESLRNEAAAPCSHSDAGSVDAIARIINPGLFVEYDLLVQKGTVAENGRPWAEVVFGKKIEALHEQARTIIAALATPPALPAGEEVRRATIEECSEIAEKEAGAWLNGPATTAVGQAYQRAARNIAANIRALSPSSNGKPA